MLEVCLIALNYGPQTLSIRPWLRVLGSAYAAQVEAVTDYIGANLDGELSVRTLAGIAPNPHGVVAKEIPGGRCARIRHLGTREHMAEAEYIYRDWLPASGQNLRDFPAFFHYVNVGPDIPESEMISDVYLPLE